MGTRWDTNVKSDFGAHLYAIGVSPEVELAFYDVPIDHLSVTDVPSLTTMVNTVHDGVEYAVSFDFSEAAGARLLANAPPNILTALRQAGQATDVRRRTITLAPPLRVNLKAQLGNLETGPSETFAPLIVNDVSF